MRDRTRSCTLVGRLTPAVRSPPPDAQVIAGLSASDAILASSPAATPGLLTDSTLQLYAMSPVKAGTMPETAAPIDAALATLGFRGEDDLYMSEYDRGFKPRKCERAWHGSEPSTATAEREPYASNGYGYAAAAAATASAASFQVRYRREKPGAAARWAGEFEAWARAASARLSLHTGTTAPGWSAERYNWWGVEWPAACGNRDDVASYVRSGFATLSAGYMYSGQYSQDVLVEQLHGALDTSRSSAHPITLAFLLSRFASRRASWTPTPLTQGLYDTIELTVCRGSKPRPRQRNERTKQKHETTRTQTRKAPVADRHTCLRHIVDTTARQIPMHACHSFIAYSVPSAGDATSRARVFSYGIACTGDALRKSVSLATLRVFRAADSASRATNGASKDSESQFSFATIGGGVAGINTLQLISCYAQRGYRVTDYEGRCVLRVGESLDGPGRTDRGVARGPPTAREMTSTFYRGRVVRPGEPPNIARPCDVAINIDRGPSPYTRSPEMFQSHDAQRFAERIERGGHVLRIDQGDAEHDGRYSVEHGTPHGCY